MTLLTVIQNATDGLTGVSRPSVVIASTDQNVKTLLRLANVEGRDLAQRHPWQVLNNTATHTTVATQSQGTIASIAGTDFDYIIPETMWNRTQQRMVDGPIPPQERQLLLARTQAGPYSQWWISGGTLNFYPAPAASQTVAFEWQSKNWCESSVGTGQSAWAADNDVGVLDETIMTQGIIWRFLKTKGLDYAEDFRTYEMWVANAIGRDGGRRTLNAGSPRPARGLAVPDGSWSV